MVRLRKKIYTHKLYYLIKQKKEQAFHEKFNNQLV